MGPVSVIIALILLTAPAWSQVEPTSNLPPRDSPTSTSSSSGVMLEAVIDNVTLDSYGDHIDSITVDFVSLEDNPFDYEYDDFGRQILGSRAECFAHKLVFSDGSTTFNPQHPGICTSYFYSSYDSRVYVRLDNQDYLDFILAGFATPPYPDLLVYTTEDSSEGEFPITVVSEDDPLFVTYDTYEERNVGFDDVTYNAITSVLLINFRTFIRISSLNITQIMFSTENFFDISPTNSFNLTGGVLLTRADALAIDVAIAITTHDLQELHARNICVSNNNRDCRMYSGPDLAESYNGLPTEDNHYGYYPRLITPVASVPVYFELTIQYLGYSMQVPLQYTYPHHLRYYGGHYERITRLICFADGIDNTDPEIFLNNEPIDNRYLTRNWPTQITLSADNGVALENLLGYFSCETRGDSFQSFSVITYEYNYIFFYEGASIEVDLHDSIVIPFAHNDESVVTYSDPSFHFGLSEGLGFNPPSFRFTTNVSDISPYVAEIHIFDLTLSDSGSYRILIYGHIPSSGLFNLTVRPPRLTITPPDYLYVLPNDTRATITCNTTMPEVGTAWVINGVQSILPTVYLVTNHLELLVTPTTINSLNGTVYECVAYDPDVIEGPPEVISRAKTVFLKATDFCGNGLDDCDSDFGTCINRFGSYVCGCKAGYIIGADNHCVPEPTTTVMSPETTESTTILPVMCPSENDPVWWLPFPDTLAGETYTRECPQNGTSSISGYATRSCSADGAWNEVDTSDCTRQDFAEVEDTATELFAANVSDIDPAEVSNLIVRLKVATSNSTTGGSMSFAKDLNTTNKVIKSTVQYLLNSIDIAGSTTLLEFNEDIIDVFDNVLDDSSTNGWQDLQENSAGSQQLLLNAETYGQYVARSLMSSSVDIGNQSDVTLVRNNIQLSAKEVDPGQVERILFPVNVETSEELGSAQTEIPVELLNERGAENGKVSAVNILFTNLKMFLPQDKLERETKRPVTQVLSTQILGSLPKDTFDTPARFKYTTQKFSDEELAENATCAFWDFSGNIADSFWSTAGVNTTNVTETEDGVFEVVCVSSHFTSFAVLMDVTGALNKTSPEEQFALRVVSYIGCALSIFFLFISILYFFSLGKELFKKVHQFIHLNLAIALFLGYVAFVAGVETAIVNRGLCVFVAALLHYLFTAVFCWMLCEGIMLYLMLVIVFSELTKKWWIFFLLGWAVPIVPVAISVGVINDQYGTASYCWISAGDGTRGAIWAFVIPMLIIIMLNVFFLLAALRSIFRQRKLKNKMQGDNDKLALFKQLFKAVIILLPLLGLTWVFGLLLVDNNTTFFAWIFTICNTLQGLFFFYFHVLRNIKMWQSVKHRYSERRSTFSQSTLSRKSTSNFTVRSQLTVSEKHSSISEATSGFSNPAFVEPIEEEKPEAQEIEIEKKTPPPEKEEPVEAYNVEPVVDESTLIEIDETLFELEGSDKDSDDSGDESRKTWTKTVTFNWMRPAPKEEDDLDALMLAD